MTQTHWAERIIDEHNLSKTDIARACGISVQHLCNAINGHAKLGTKAEARLSEVLAVFDNAERAKRQFALPIIVKKTFLPCLERIRTHCIRIDPAVIFEPEAKTREEIAAQHERVRAYARDIEAKRPLPPIIAVKVGKSGFKFLLLKGREVLMAAAGSLYCSTLDAYVYEMEACDVPFLAGFELSDPSDN
jgi:hypothetical protein